MIVSRRRFLQASLAAAAASPLRSALGGLAAPRPKNVLLLLSDEHHRGATSFLGQALRLGRMLGDLGVKEFTNVYCAMVRMVDD